MMNIRSIVAGALLGTGTLAMAACLPAPPPVVVDCAAPAAPSVNWSGCDKSGLELDGADLSGVVAVGTNFTGASLTSVNMTGADLTGARFVDGSIFGVNLVNAKLTGVDFTRAGIGGTDMTGADLTGAIVTDSWWDVVTCPDGTNSADGDGSIPRYLPCPVPGA